MDLMEIIWLNALTQETDDEEEEETEGGTD